MENEICILKTLCYADIFNYPLTEEEIFTYLISKNSIEKSKIRVILQNSVHISSKDGYFMLKKRLIDVGERTKRKKISTNKIALAQKYARILSYIPTVQLIAVSGNLAVENAQHKDDIDFFIITQSHTLWITRFIILALLELTGKRRKKKDTKEENKICVNMIVDTTTTAFSKDRQDLYTAHEIAQLKPLINKGHTYELFLNSNKWVIQYLPNALDIKKLIYKDIGSSKKTNFFISQLLNFLESFAKKIQLWYMHSSITKEYISDGFVAFHPFDYKKYVLEEYNKRCKEYGIKTI